MSGVQAWGDLWRDAAADDDRGVIGDVCSGIDIVTDDGPPDDPDEVIALAVAGAQAAEATAAGLDGPWALYTPQQAAIVASALFAQIDAAGTALEKLSEYLHVMDARGDVELPEFDGAEVLNLGNAEARLGRIGQAARASLNGEKDTVQVLAQEPYLGRLPADAHETITAVAALLSDAGTLVCAHHLHDQAELEESYRLGYGCGCYITLHDSRGKQWQFQRGDSAWTLFSIDSVDANGTVHESTELAATHARAHPGHVAALLQHQLQLPARQGHAHG